MFLAATTAGVATAVGSVVIFGAVTIGTIVGLTLGAARGGYQIKGDWLDRWGNAVTAVVLVRDRRAGAQRSDLVDTG